MRFNSLKIFINATEAKPGGNIGAMLSPYLFSTNMSDFCKKFNEQSKELNNFVILPVYLYVDILDKSYTFLIKPFSVVLFFVYFFSNEKKIKLNNLYDLVLFYSVLYKISVFNSALIILSSLKSFKKKNSIINLSFLVKQKYV